MFDSYKDQLASSIATVMGTPVRGPGAPGEAGRPGTTDPNTGEAFRQALAEATGGAQGQPTATAAAQTGQAPTPVGAASKADTETEQDPTLLELIRNKGLRNYVEELDEQKRQQMREELLERMGLSEEALSALPADAQKAIEKLIADEIQSRVSAETEVDKGIDEDQALSPIRPGQANLGDGMMVLLALQDVNPRSTLNVQTPFGTAVQP
ncbi:MAG: hypothetical protein ACPGOV_03085 [Magnetovibrionaceae bacterium]